jgi:flagellar basal body-associated protein FliL
MSRILFALLFVLLVALSVAGIAYIALELDGSKIETKRSLTRP